MRPISSGWPSTSGCLCTKRGACAPSWGSWTPLVSTAGLLLEPLGAVLDLKPDSAPDAKPAYRDELASFWTAIPRLSRGTIRDAVSSVVAALPGETGLQVLLKALEDTRRFSSDRYVM
jgi:hypothetical protein